MMATSREEVLPDKITEGWLWSFPSKELRKPVKDFTADKWKKYFFCMQCQNGAAIISLYKKPPKKRTDKVAYEHKFSEFQLHKRQDDLVGKQYICDITDDCCHTVTFRFENDSRRDSFVFFLISQRQLPANPPSGKLFSVTPVNSEAHKRIGSRGSKCLLHVCKSGLTLSFQKAHCIIAQWPLNSIRNYKCSGAGCFAIEAGRRAPMGEGVYEFITVKGEDDDIYSLFARYVAETIKSLKKQKDDQIYDEYCSLRILASSPSDSRFTRFLQRASSTNFNDSQVDSVSQNQINGSWEGSLTPDSMSGDFLPSCEQKLSALEEWVSPVSQSQPINGRQRSPHFSRQRSKTEDPLSLASYGEGKSRTSEGYIDMTGSLASLNILQDGEHKKRNLPLPSTPSSRTRGINHMLKSPTMHSTGAEHLRSPVNRYQRTNSHSSSVSSLAFSPLNIATPPPAFYEAMDLPDHPAPTPPENWVPQTSKSFDDPYSPTSPVSDAPELPPKTRARKQIFDDRSVESVEDPSDSFTRSLDDWRGYDNAIFANDPMSQFEVSVDLPPVHGTSATSGVVSEPAEVDTVDGTMNREALHTSAVYSLAETAAEDEEVKEEIVSTYLYGKTIACMTTGGKSPAESKGTQSEVSQSIPPELPTTPRPSINRSVKRTLLPVPVNMSEIPATQPDNDVGDVSRASTLKYEDIDEMGLMSERSTSTGTSSLSNHYEKVDEKKMIRKKSLIKEPTTIWHISLDGEVIDNPVPDGQDISAELSLVSQAFAQAQMEAAEHNNRIDQLQPGHTMDDEDDAYLLPTPSPLKSPPDEVLLPLPPETDSDSEDERTHSGLSAKLGSLRKIFSRSKLSRSKSSDLLDSSASTSIDTPSSTTTRKSSGKGLSAAADRV